MPNKENQLKNEEEIKEEIKPLDKLDSDTSPFNYEKTYFNQKTFDINFDFMPFSQLTPHGVNLRFLRGIGVLDFSSPITNHPSSINLQRLFLKQNTIMSFFEGIEDVAAAGSSTTRGWDIASTNSGTATAAIGGLQLATGITNNSKILMEANTGSNDVSFDDNPCFSVLAKTSATSNQTIFMGVGDYDTGITAKYIGFKISGSSLTGISQEGSGADDTLSISGITLTDWNIYTCIMTSANRIDFYVNQKYYGSLNKSASITLPSGTGDMPIQFSVSNATDGVTKILYLRHVTFSQDI